MKRFLKYVVMAVIAIVAVSCEVAMEDNFNNDVPPYGPENGGNDGDDKPTTPIKRRPIVPSTNLPRPRVIGYENFLSGTISSCEVVEIEEAEELYDQE